MSTATTHMDNKTSLQASHCEDEGRSKRKQSHPLVPALRFSEFDGDWDKKKIREVLTIGSGKDYKHLKPGNIPVYGTGGLMAKVDTPIHNGKTVFIGRKGSIDKPFYYDGDFWTVDTLFYTHSFQETEPYFVYGLFQKINWYKHNEASGVPSLSKTTIGSLVVNLPSLPEQQKIASFLSAVDEKIQQLTKKKALLEQYKKGLMQQLFSRQLRFKDENGNPYPDWEEKRLGEISKITTGSSNREDSGLDGEFTFFDRSKDIRTSSIYLFDGEAIIVPGEGQEFIPKYFIGKFDLHQRTYAIMNFENSISKFLFFYVHYHRHYFFRQAVGTTVKSLRLPMFKKMPVKLPCIEEQQKIARYLSRIDTKIESVNNQITQTQTFKKGLLQQLFV